MRRVFAELRLSPRALSWLTVAGLVASATALADESLGVAPTLLYVLASVASQTTVLLMALLLIPRYLQRNPVLLVPLLMTSGALRGFTLSWLSIGELYTALAQAANASITNLVWGTVALTLISQRDKFDLAYRQQTAQLLINPRSFKVGSQPEIAQLSERLREIVQDINSSDALRRPPLEKLGQEIRDILEPLQLRLSVGKNLRPQIGVVRLIWSAVKRPDPSPLFVVTTWTALTVGGAFTLFGPIRASFSLVIAGLLLITILWLAARTKRSFPRHLLIALSVVLPTVASDLVMTTAGLESGLSEPVVSLFAPLACLSLTVFSTSIHLIQADREKVLGQLRAQTTPQSDFEDYVHSSVQGVLLQLVSKFLGLRNPTEEDFQELARELNAFLSRDFDEEFSRRQLSPDERLRVLETNWSPILRVEIADEFLGEVSALVKQQALMVLEEGIRNASRHAGATWVRAESHLVSEERLQITISSDRNTPPGPKSQGGGQRMFDKICISWRLELTATTTKLVADLLVF